MTEQKNDELEPVATLEDETAHLVNEWVGTADDTLEDDRGHFRDPIAPPETEATSDDAQADEPEENSKAREEFYRRMFCPVWEMPASVDPAFSRLRITPEKEPYAQPASDVVFDALEYLFPDFGERSEFIGKIGALMYFGMIQRNSYREAMNEIQARQLEDTEDKQGVDPRRDQGGASELSWMDGEKPA